MAETTMPTAEGAARGHRDDVQLGSWYSPHCSDTASDIQAEPPGRLECELLARSDFPSREGLAALRFAGVPDALIVEVREADARYLTGRFWEFCEGGLPSLVLPVRDAFGETIDALAWPVSRPDKFARLTGRAVLLGEASLGLARLGEPVPCWRSPLRWLGEGGDGLVILDSADGMAAAPARPCARRRGPRARPRGARRSRASRPPARVGPQGCPSSEGGGLNMREDIPPPARPLEVVNAASLAGRVPPPRVEHVAGMIPAGNVTLLGGDGGTGKSLLALQLAVATTARTQWIGQTVAAGPVLFLTAEDEVAEVHRRLACICDCEGIDMAGLDGLDILSLAGMDALLSVAEGRGGTMKTTPLFAQLEEWIGEHPPALVVFDTLADLFGGEENARAHARQFIGQLRGIAIRHQTTVLLLAHPSLNGMASGAGTSGNTAWSNSVRSRLYLERLTVRDGERATEPDPDVRVLRTMKANYGRTGGEIRVRWTDGLFVPCGGGLTGNSAALEAIRAERVFLDLLASYTAQGRWVSASPSSTFAPTVFSRDARADGMTRTALTVAMNSLFAEGRIMNEMFGPPSKQRSRITLKRDGDDASD